MPICHIGLYLLYILGSERSPGNIRNVNNLAQSTSIFFLMNREAVFSPNACLLIEMMRFFSRLPRFRHFIFYKDI